MGILIKKVIIMNILDVKKFGMAFGATFGLFYLGCVIVVMSSGKEGIVFLYNTLLHGIDVSSIIRTEMPIINMIIGLVEFTIFGWLLGATIASIYNYSMDGEASKEINYFTKKKKRKSIQK